MGKERIFEILIVVKSTKEVAEGFKSDIVDDCMPDGLELVDSSIKEIVRWIK